MHERNSRSRLLQLQNAIHFRLLVVDYNFHHTQQHSVVETHAVTLLFPLLPSDMYSANNYVSTGDGEWRCLTDVGVCVVLE